MAKDNINNSVFDRFEEKILTVNGIPVNVAVAGKGQPIVLIHGWTNDWRGLAPLGAEVAQKMKVIIVDLPGYGKSGRLKNYSLEIEARWIKELALSLKLGKFYLLGHSMGSFVAAKFYEKYQSDLLGLIMVGGVFRKKARKHLIEAGHWIYGWAENHTKAQKMIEYLIKKRAYAYLAAYLMNMYKFDRKLVDKYGTISRKNIDIKAYIEIGEELLATNTEEMLVKRKRPILFLYGKYDKICNAEQAREVMGKHNCSYAEIEEAGHVVTVEKPEETAKEILSFLGMWAGTNRPGTKLTAS